MTPYLLGGDRPVNRLGFGAMRLALGGQVHEAQAGIAILRRAIELGVNHIDTAGFYGIGDLNAHEMIRDALSPYPDDLVIATKVGPMREGGIWPTANATPDQLRVLVEDDLRRLGQDRLDLVYLRVPGPEPIADRFAALAELQREGLIGHLGVSNITASQLAEAQSIVPVAAVQNHFHIQNRSDADILAHCEKQNIAFVPYFPLGGGRDRLDPASLAPIAATYGVSTAQVALAWLLACSPAILAIPGSSTLEHLTENVAATALELTPDDLAAL